MADYSQSVLSLQEILIPVVPYAYPAVNPVSDPVAFAFTPLTYPATQPSAWLTGSWLTFPGPSYYAQCLVGPGTASSGAMGTALSIGTYQIWLRIQAAGETPVLQPSTIEITP